MNIQNKIQEWKERLRLYGHTRNFFSRLQTEYVSIGLEKRFDPIGNGLLERVNLPSGFPVTKRSFYGVHEKCMQKPWATKGIVGRLN